MKSDLIGNLKDALENVDDFTAGYLELTRDPLFHKIPANLRGDIIKTAINIGRETAAKIVEETKTVDPWRIVEFLGLDVNVICQENVTAGLLIRSEYVYPKTIRIYNQSIEQLKKVVHSFALEDFFSDKAILNLHVAHEIFHYLEKTLIGVLSEQYPIEHFRLGPLRFKIRVRAISEIAAHTFAKTLTGVKILPSVLDYIAMDGSIENLLVKLAEIKREIGQLF
ncbi:MAG: hypothetical protein RMJ15_10925 [Nitrososphaerota archaeon]|nr:hypothetical protein [Candidatus Bathyarchaeota archaeon]MDW8024220.1 hypothetical protein [Nitrososphaerota archaeon]